ncbi:AraC family transcriptional regulator [Ravibacter arvi]|uniref:AraC family transcriptional regulator n=1 Tax=Ravibacter arvi TaxID=2051041 RepID=A0ABP8LS99_9BACT
MNKIRHPNLLNVPVSEERSFDLRHEIVPYFANPWHFHPELELNFLVSGTGTRFIGQHAGRFDAGEIVLLGRNLPHFWKSDQAYYTGEGRLTSEAIIVRFRETFAGRDFLGLPELYHIRALMERAQGGIKLLEPLRASVARQMLSMEALDDFRQMLVLLGILQEIAISDAVEIISPEAIATNVPDKKKDKRLGKVVAYLLENLNGRVRLKEIAGLANMNEAAFCRYFKSQTGKTLTQYTLALRMDYAGNLLVNSNESVTQVCYSSGFENVSHFIQTFRRHHGLTPFEFRKRLKGKAMIRESTAFPR